jgi:hypothetical protein
MLRKESKMPSFLTVILFGKKNSNPFPFQLRTARMAIILSSLLVFTLSVSEVQSSLRQLMK